MITTLKVMTNEQFHSFDTLQRNANSKISTIFIKIVKVN